MSIAVKTLKVGECWSLRGMTFVKGLPPAVLVVKEGEKAAQWQVAPLFFEGGMASDEDVLLDPEPEWLLGENWCALGKLASIHTSSLYRRLGRLQPALISEIQQELDGRPSRLMHGTPLWPELGDPRCAFHDNLHDLVERLGCVRLLQHLRVLWNEKAKDISSRCSAILESLRGDESLNLPGLRIPQPAFRSTGSRSNIGSGATSEYGWEISIPDLPVPVQMYARPDKDGWRIRLSAVGLSSVNVVSESGEFSLDRLGEGAWDSEELNPFPPGEYAIELGFEPPMVFDLTLPALPEEKGE